MTEINSPTVIHKQADSDYRAVNARSQSELKEILASPAHYRARYGPDGEAFFPTPAMQIGTALHHRVLEPDTFSKHFVSKADTKGDHTIPELKEIAKEKDIDIKGKSKKSDLMAAVFPDGAPKERRKVFSEKDWLIVHGAADALRTHDVTGSWFDPGFPNYRKFNEVSIYDRDFRGIVRKARLDRIHIDLEAGCMNILDIKGCEDCSPQGFTRSVVAFKYHLQAFYYTDMVRRAVGAGLLPDMPINFYFCAVERKRPFSVNVFKATDEILEEGARLCDKALLLYAQCLELNYWPGYDPVIHDLKLPSWSQAVEEDIEF
ncbi:exonuclease VIII [Cyanophage PSS2]|uniref:exonuclease VIII n=1 Tax=Cyanophage PSS2 TaxID=658401 RepID=UPI0001B04050|nr:exonuclease VIII [Cyanophage PSS2]ACT65685.1 helicase/exonuclease VIII 5'-3' [Cyanophage PSS2]